VSQSTIAAAAAAHHARPIQRSRHISVGNSKARANQPEYMPATLPNVHGNLKSFHQHSQPSVNFSKLVITLKLGKEE